MKYVHKMVGFPGEIQLSSHQSFRFPTFGAPGSMKDTPSRAHKNPTWDCYALRTPKPETGSNLKTARDSGEFTDSTGRFGMKFQRNFQNMYTPS